MIGLSTHGGRGRGFLTALLGVVCFGFAACGPYDPEDADYVVGLVEGCYFDGSEKILDIKGRQIYQGNGELYSEIVDSASLKTWVRLTTEHDVFYDSNIQALVKGRDVRAGILYREVGNTIEINVNRVGEGKILAYRRAC